MLASCLSDDTDDSNIVYYGDAAITSFSLGTLNKTYLYNNGDTIKKNTDGTDSTTTVDCSKYKLTIDQLKHEVYNVDSLPAGGLQEGGMCCKHKERRYPCSEETEEEGYGQGYTRLLYQ